MENGKRAGRVSVERKDVIANFMFDHMDFARGKLLGPEGKITSKNLWVILCQQLHAVGPEKTMTQWQRVWKDMRMKVKKQASSLYTGRVKTGGGPLEDIGLTDIEENILAVMSKISVFGIDGPEGLPLDSEEAANNVQPRPGSSIWVSFAESIEGVRQHSENEEFLSPICTLSSEEENFTPSSVYSTSITSDTDISATPLTFLDMLPI